MVISSFGNGSKIGARLHFNDRKVVLGVFFQKSFVFQESTKDRDGFLVGEDGSLVVGEGEESAKAVFEHISVLGVFVKNGPGNLDITDFAIENSGFAQDIDTPKIVDVLKNSVEDIVGSKAEGIVDIEKIGVGLRNFSWFGDFKPGIKVAGFDKISDGEDLGIDVKIMGAGDIDNI